MDRIMILAVMAVFSAFIAAFFILLITKIGLRDYVIAAAPKLLSELFSCDFCLSWWTCLLLCSLSLLYVPDWHMPFMAIIASPLTRRLIQ